MTEDTSGKDTNLVEERNVLSQNSSLDSGLEQPSALVDVCAEYLANTMEEDYEEAKYEIFPWALGKNWRKHFTGFLASKDHLWSRINYRAAVMAIAPTHNIWQRDRSEHHSGALRTYSDEFRIPRGPCATPQDCSLCGKKGQLVGVGLCDSSSSSSSSSLSDTTLSVDERRAQHKILDSPSDKMLIDPPQCYHYHQDMLEKKQQAGKKQNQAGQLTRTEQMARQDKTSDSKTNPWNGSRATRINVSPSARRRSSVNKKEEIMFTCMSYLPGHRPGNGYGAHIPIYYRLMLRSPSHHTKQMTNSPARDKKRLRAPEPDPASRIISPGLMSIIINMEAMSWK
ncbi:unnamed protein product [Ranitomeya imitator]|uniref:Uncharacterized protein n=1 Tax=Ranitomeya imitator TaxID=111125 RepID=A0ABN9LKU2_9NEOB|nr:unnamed protein product [Ranitomeya imitator]